MINFLRLKHWQLFFLLVGIPLILSFISIGALITGMITVIFYVFPILVLVMGCFFGWLYTVGANLYKILPQFVSMNFTRFKIFLIIPALYFVLTNIFMFILVSKRLFAHGEIPNLGFIGFIIPLHLFAMFCIFYCLYFIAKALKVVEWQKPVTFSDFAGDFLLIWFYPIGIWIIQPRINKIFGSNNVERMSY